LPWKECKHVARDNLVDITIGVHTPSSIVIPHVNCKRNSLEELATDPSQTLLSAGAVGVEGAVADWLVDNNVAITDFNVVQACWIGTDPCLVLNRSSLAAEIRKRNQITITTLATPRKGKFHEIASFLLSGGNCRLPASHQGQARLTRKLAEGEPPPLHPHPHSRYDHAVTIIPQVLFYVSREVKNFSYFSGKTHLFFCQLSQGPSNLLLREVMRSVGYVVT
jgi:hypothetical protein